MTAASISRWSLQHLWPDAAQCDRRHAGPGGTSNPAPHGRIAYEWNWAGQSAHVGGLVLHSNLNPTTGDRTVDGSVGRDSYTDWAFDAGY
jgi:hypothetical protein